MESCSRTIMPCAACRLLRRRCTNDCLFRPYFPPAEPEKFAAVHRIFGASNMSKMLQEVPVDHRGDAVTSLVYEATARLQEPVYGCVALIASLQKQVFQLQSELDEVLAENATLRAQLSVALSLIASCQSFPSVEDSNQESNHQLQPSECGNSDNSDMMLQYDQVTDSYTELANMFL
ncbi:LOB domain-containing protein 4 [Sesamum alatum]|uniref:LOB domain-containing protein 4 n=1 Tax=Sesamum alatum TaxID=300844 RepID=A0AAE1Z3U4_9LAMI|nr:LOB domain-containing protein 4 [Sesamum alatum]